MRPRNIVAIATLSITALLSPALPATATVPAPTTVAPAVAKAAGKVSVKKIGTKAVEKGKKAVIKASYKSTGKVKIVSTRLTATKSGKSVGKNKASLSLGAGTYKLTQKITYKPASGKGWGKARSSSLTQTLKVRTKAQWEIWGETFNATVVQTINDDRAGRGLKPLKRDKAYRTQTAAAFNKNNWKWLEKQPANFSAGAQNATGTKAEARSFARDTVHLIKNEGDYAAFVSAKRTKIAVAAYVYADKKGRPTAFETWVAAK